MIWLFGMFNGGGERVVILISLMCDSCKKEKPSSEPSKSKILSKPNASKRAVKLVLCGNAAVGKTSITMRYKEGVFKKIHEPTLAGAYQEKKIKTKNG